MTDKVRLIISPEGLRKARSELAYFFRKIAYKAGVNGTVWDYRLRRYLDNLQNSPRNSKDRSYARGNLNTQLFDDRMTWNVFKQGLIFLGATKVNMRLEITWESKKVRVYDMDIRMRQTEVHLTPSEQDLEEFQLEKAEQEERNNKSKTDPTDPHTGDDPPPNNVVYMNPHKKPSIARRPSLDDTKSSIVKFKHALDVVGSE